MDTNPMITDMPVTRKAKRTNGPAPGSSKNRFILAKQFPYTPRSSTTGISCFSPIHPKQLGSATANAVNVAAPNNDREPKCSNNFGAISNEITLKTPNAIQQRDCKSAAWNGTSLDFSAILPSIITSGDAIEKFAS